MRVFIIYDNHAREGFSSGWGFAAMLEIGKEKILFDTGDNPESLLHNMRSLSIEPSEIGTVVISHEHGDHIGGLAGFLEMGNPKARVVRQGDFTELTKIAAGVYTTGSIQSNGAPDEQSLYAESSQGKVLLVGCSHPGVDKILDMVKASGNVYAIIGGFHGFDRLDRLKSVQMIAPCHCTKHINEIRQMYPSKYLEVMAGDIIDLPD